MVELYAEAGVKRKDSLKTMFIRFLMIFGAIASFLLTFSSSILIFISIAIIIGVVFMYPRLSIEYEYVFCDGQLDIDKIMGSSKRKNILRLDLEQVQIVAPEGSHELDGYNKPDAKKKDYSSLRPDSKAYIIAVRIDGESLLIKFEPSEKMIQSMKQKSSRKIVTY